MLHSLEIHCIHCLIKVTDSTNKDKLEALIDEAKEMSEENYTKESFEALQRALEAAQVVFNNPDATQAEINAETETLQQALDSLVLVKTDKPDLPDTGQSSTMIYLIGSTLLIGAGLYLMFKKEEEQ